MLSMLRQTFAVTRFGLASLPARAGTSAVTVAGIAGVVVVFVGILSIASGFQATLASTGDPSTVLVMRAGSDSEMTSGLGLDETRFIKDAPGVARDAEGPVASAELFVIVDLDKRSTGTSANVPLRGLEPSGLRVRQTVDIVEGRFFELGKKEIVAGRRAADEFAGLGVGQVLRWGENEWTVVGIFETGGTVEETELWTDARVLQPAYRRGNSFQSVHLRLESPEGFQRLADALESDPRLNVKVVRESEYYAAQSEMLATLIRILGTVIGILMGIGAVFGALNTMYSAVSTRTREIATLRALGFGAGPVVVSVLVEALVLAAVGGLLGGVGAWFAFNGYQAATLNWQTFSQVAFAFRVTPALLVGGLVYALVMGFVGGVFPAIRAARMPVATALRSQ